MSDGHEGLDGRLEAVVDGVAVGWAYDWSDPQSRVAVELSVDGQIVASAVADVPRRTLAEEGLGDGRHGFFVELPARLRDGGEHAIAAVFSASGKRLKASGAFAASASSAAQEWTGTRFLAATEDTDCDRRTLRLRPSRQAQFTRRTVAQGFAGGDEPETIALAEQSTVERSRMLLFEVQRGVADPAGERRRHLSEHPPRYLAERLLVSRLPDALVDAARYVICPSERQYLLDSNRYREPLPEWGYTHIGEGIYEHEARIERQAERVVVLGAQTNLNYSHWLVESVARALLFRPLDDGSVTYLCPPLQRWQRETLALAGVPEERISIAPTRHGFVRFEEVFAISRGMSAMPLLIPGALSALATLAEPATRPGESAAQPRRRRLYVSRARVARRHVANEAELVAMLERHGFETIHPQTLDVSEQIELFAGAEVVLGSFGSGLTNLIFSPPGTLAIELEPEDNDLGGHVFVWNLTSIREQRFAQVVCPTAEGMHHLPRNMRDMTVDVGHIDELLQGLLAGQQTG